MLKKMNFASIRTSYLQSNYNEENCADYDFNEEIINIISMSVRQVVKGLGVSNTIRGSVAQWARTLALELGEFGITVTMSFQDIQKLEDYKSLLQIKQVLNITKRSF